MATTLLHGPAGPMERNDGKENSRRWEPTGEEGHWRKGMGRPPAAIVGERDKVPPGDRHVQHHWGPPGAGAPVPNLGADWCDTESDPSTERAEDTRAERDVGQEAKRAAAVRFAQLCESKHIFALQAFNHIDNHVRGKLEEDAFIEWGVTALDLSEAVMEDVFSYGDDDGNGWLTRSEFVRLLATKPDGASAATIDPAHYRKCCLMPGLCGKGGGGAIGEHVCADHAETGNFAVVTNDAIDFTNGRRQAVFNRRQQQRAFMSAGDFDSNQESSAGMNQKGLYKAYGDLTTTLANKVDASKPRGGLDSTDGRASHTAAMANYARSAKAMQFAEGNDTSLNFWLPQFSNEPARKDRTSKITEKKQELPD